MQSRDVSMQTDLYLQKIKDGDISALDSLYDLTHSILFSLCFSYFKNQEDSEDALHDSYIATIRNISKYNGKNGFNWMFTITKNTCLNLCKKASKVQSTDMTAEENINKLGADPTSEVRIFDESGIISLSHEILKENEFRILILHTVSELKFKDIAKGLGSLESTVRWQYNNAIQKVRKEYERREGHEARSKE